MGCSFYNITFQFEYFTYFFFSNFFLSNSFASFSSTPAAAKLGCRGQCLEAWGWEEAQPFLAWASVSSPQHPLAPPAWSSDTPHSCRWGFSSWRMNPQSHTLMRSHNHSHTYTISHMHIRPHSYIHSDTVTHRHTLTYVHWAPFTHTHSPFQTHKYTKKH